MTDTYRSGTLDVDAVALGIVKVFPALDRFEQRLSLELYRLLSGGQPVARAALAERLEISVDIVDRILDHWPACFLTQSDASSATGVSLLLRLTGVLIN